MTWTEKTQMAEAEVREVLAALPEPLRQRAEPLPVTCQPVPSAALVADGIEPDTLGLFVGPDFGHEVASVAPVAPQIFLFIDNLWDLAESDPEVFREEVRTTVLHELGHYLGLDEDDLMDRGLG